MTKVPVLGVDADDNDNLRLDKIAAEMEPRMSAADVRSQPPTH